MPTYEYVCQKCNHQFEIVQSINDKALTVCPKERCARKPWAKGNIKRMIVSGAGLIFKGSGFYITDYRSSEYKEAAKKDSNAAASSSASAEGKKSAASAKAESSPTKTESTPAKTKTDSKA